MSSGKNIYTYIHIYNETYTIVAQSESFRRGNYCSFCRLKSLHDSVVGMCSAGSSNVNILHPPSHSPVPGPGIPHPSNGRLVPSLFLFLSVSIAHKHTRTYSLFVPMQLLQTSYFLSCLLATHISSFPLCRRPILHSSFIPLPSSYLFPFNNPPPSLPQLLSHLFAWQSVKDADSVEQGQQSPPVSIQARAEICNARQHSAMQG